MTLENLRKAMLLNNMEMLLRLKKYLHIHENLAVLNQLSMTDDGHFNFGDSTILSDIDISKVPGNAIEKREDGYFVAANNPTEDEIQKMINDMWKELMQSQHHFSTQWSSDAVNHWHECTDADCDEISEKGPHAFNDGVTTLQPTFETNGTTTYTCEVCGYTKESVIPHLEHSYANTYSSDITHHWYACTDPGYQNLYQNKMPHDWDEGVITIDPTFEKTGIKTFTCNDCGYQRTEDIANLKHSYDTNWTTDETYHWLKCLDEGYESLNKDKAKHIWDGGIVTKQPDVGVEGETTFTCTVCGITKIEKIDALPQPEPNPEEPVVSEEPSDPIVITQQPQSIQLDNNFSGTLSIQAEGTGLTYQWYVLKELTSQPTVMSDDNVHYDGAKTDTLNLHYDYTSINDEAITNNWKDNCRYYYCVITDESGNTVTSSAVTTTLPSETE